MDLSAFNSSDSVLSAFSIVWRELLSSCILFSIIRSGRCGRFLKFLCFEFRMRPSCLKVRNEIFSPSSRSSVSIESDLGLVSKWISSGHSIGMDLSLILCHLVRKPKPGKVNLSLLYLLMCSSVPNLNLSTRNTKKISMKGGVEATRSWKRDCFLVDAF